MAQSTAVPAPPASAAAPDDVFARLRAGAEERLRQFQQGAVTPLAAYTLEKELQALFDEAARALLQQTFERLEPVDQAAADAKVRYRGQTYRRSRRCGSGWSPSTACAGRTTGFVGCCARSAAAPWRSGRRPRSNGCCSGSRR